MKTSISIILVLFINTVFAQQTRQSQDTDQTNIFPFVVEINKEPQTVEYDKTTEFHLRIKVEAKPKAASRSYRVSSFTATAQFKEGGTTKYLKIDSLRISKTKEPITVKNSSDVLDKKAYKLFVYSSSEVLDTPNTAEVLLPKKLLIKKADNIFQPLLVDPKNSGHPVEKLTNSTLGWAGRICTFSLINYE